jgi:hypothetical protein
MRRRLLNCLLPLVCALGVTAPARAQTSPADSPSRRNAARERPAPENSDEAARLRRDTAVAMLVELAADARGYKDRGLGARVRGLAADVLWDADEERARSLFRETWEEAADAAESRDEILRIAARRDHALGEEFLQKRIEAEEKDARGNATDARPDPTLPAAAVAQRLGLAKSLLDRGEVARAAEFAVPALEHVTSPGVTFLSELREKDGPVADQLYEALLGRTTSDPTADANDISILSSYIFTPYMFFTATSSGGTGIIQRRGATPPTDMPPRLRSAFFGAAAQVLLREPPQSANPASAGRRGTYLIIVRLLPLFETHAPGRVPALRARLASLSTRSPEDLPAEIQKRLGEGLRPGDTPGDEVKDALAALNETTDPARRDQIYAKAAVAAARNNGATARETAEKIRNDDLRRGVLAYVAFVAANEALKGRDAERALELIKGAELSPAQSVLIHTEAARLLKGRDPARSARLLDDAAEWARRADKNDPDRARALLAVATAWLEFDGARAWEVAGEAVKAANAASGFTGNDGGVSSRLRLGDETLSVSFSGSGFSLAEIFSRLAKENPNLASGLARGLTGEAARSYAILAIARSLLERSGKLTTRNNDGRRGMMLDRGRRGYLPLRNL